MFNIPSKYLENSKSYKKILATNAQAMVTNEDLGYSAELFLDINKKNIISQAGYELFEMAEMVGAFAYYTATIEGLSLKDVIALDFSKVKKDQLFFLPHLLFIRAIEQFYGEDKKILDLCNTTRSELICRCFGLGEHKIKDLLLEDTHLNLKTVMDLTQASTGCGLCSADISNVITELRDYHHIIPGFNVGESAKRFDIDGKRVRPRNESPFVLLPKIEEVLIELGIKKQILSLNGYELKLISQPEGMNSDFIETCLYDNLKIKFKIIF